MAFELRKGERVSKGIRRIVCKRIDKALRSLQRGRAVSDQGIHNARRRFKEIRGALRLVRSELGEKTFDRENHTFRDAGRPLSAVRDAKVLFDSLNGLIGRFDGRVKHIRLADLKRNLQKRRRETRTAVLHRNDAISGIVRHVQAARKRVKMWPLKKRGWKGIEGGLKKVYSQGRRAMQDASDDPSDGTFHEWRKRAKDLRYELELLQAIWPETIKPLAEQAHHLTDLLGDDHDLAVLRDITKKIGNDPSPVDIELLFALIDERRAALQKEAMELGSKLYEEPAVKFTARVKGYWEAAKRT